MAVVYDPEQAAPKSRIVYDEAAAPALSDVSDADFEEFKKLGFNGTKEELQRQMVADSQPHEKSIPLKTVSAVEAMPGAVADAAKTWASTVSPNPLKNARATAEGIANLGSSALSAFPAMFAQDPAQYRQEHTYTPRYPGGDVLPKLVSAVTAPAGELIGGSLRGAGSVIGMNPDRAQAIGEAAMMLAPIKMKLNEIAARAAEARSKIPPKNPTELARSAGYMTKPSESEGAGMIAKTAEGLAGSPKLEVEMSVKNQPVTNNHARGEIGLPETGGKINEAELDALREPHNDVYQQVADTVKTFVPDKQYESAVNGLAGKRGLSKAGKDETANLQADYAPENMQISAADAMKDMQSLRADASKTLRSASPSTVDVETAYAKQKLAKSIEEQLERQAENDAPDLLDRFRDARTALAKIHTVEDSLVNGGDVSAHEIAKYAEKNPNILTGRLKLIADVAKNHPNVTRDAGSLKNRVPVTAAEGIIGGLATAGGIAAHAPIAVPVVASMLARPITRMRLMSDAYQNRLGVPASNFGPDSALAEYFKSSRVPTPKQMRMPLDEPLLQSPPGEIGVPPKRPIHMPEDQLEVRLEDMALQHPPGNVGRSLSGIMARNKPATPLALPAPKQEPIIVTPEGRAGTAQNFQELGLDETSSAQQPQALRKGQSMAAITADAQLRALDAAAAKSNLFKSKNPTAAQKLKEAAYLKERQRLINASKPPIDVSEMAEGGKAESPHKTNLQELRNAMTLLAYKIPGLSLDQADALAKKPAYVISGVAQNFGYGIDDKGELVPLSEIVKGNKADLGIVEAAKSIPTMIPGLLSAAASGAETTNPAMPVTSYLRNKLAQALSSASQYSDAHMPDWAAKAPERSAQIREKVMQEMDLPEPVTTSDKVADLAGQMLGQFPLPGKKVEAAAMAGRGAVNALKRAIGAVPEYLGPTVRATPANYATGVAGGMALQSLPSAVDYFRTPELTDSERNAYADLAKRYVETGHSMPEGMADGGKVGALTKALHALSFNPHATPKFKANMLDEPIDNLLYAANTAHATGKLSDSEHMAAKALLSHYANAGSLDEQGVDALLDLHKKLFDTPVPVGPRLVPVTAGPLTGMGQATPEEFAQMTGISKARGGRLYRRV